MNDDHLQPSVEAEHLRRLLDIQPACLLRLGADGALLAVNDAALSWLGVTSRAQALGRDIAAWIPSDQQPAFRTFAAKVVHGTPSSIECDIEPSSGGRLTTLFNAIPLAGHPDGLASILVAIRAVSGQRQVEAAIVELEEQLRERDRELLTARARLAEEAEANARAQAEVQQLDMALKAFSKRRNQAAADAELEEARAARARVEDLLQKAQQGLTQLQQRERDAVEQRDALQARFDETRAQFDQARVRFDEAQANWRERQAELEARHASLTARLDSAETGCRERDDELRRLKAAHEELASAHTAAAAEYDRVMGGLRDAAAHLGVLADGRRSGGGVVSAAAGAPAARRDGERP